MHRMRIWPVMICFLMLLCICCTEKVYKTQKHLLTGSWVPEDDSLVTISFSNDKVYHYYNDVRGEIETYSVSADTLIINDRQYEIMGLGKIHLSLMYLQNGKIFLYRRKLRN